MILSTQFEHYASPLLFDSHCRKKTSSNFKTVIIVLEYELPATYKLNNIRRNRLLISCNRLHLSTVNILSLYHTHKHTHKISLHILYILTPILLQYQERQNSYYNYKHVLYFVRFR